MKQHKRPICLLYVLTFAMLQQLATFILPPKFMYWPCTYTHQGTGFSLLGGWVGAPPHQPNICSFRPLSHPEKFSCYNPIKTSFLAVVIALVPFYFSFILFAHTSHANFENIMQYLQKVIFSFEKGSNGQNHSSGFQHPVKKIPPQQNFRPPPPQGGFPSPPLPGFPNWGQLVGGQLGQNGQKLHENYKISIFG